MSDPPLLKSFRAGSQMGSRKGSRGGRRRGSTRRTRSTKKKSFKKMEVWKHFAEPDLQFRHVKRFVGWSTLRLFVHDVVENKWFSGIILAVIFLNTVLISLQTSRNFQILYGWYFAVVDSTFLGVYIMEIVLKLYVWRSDFFSNDWNNFDFGIVALSIVEVLWLIVVGQLAGFNPKIFRLLRVFRAIRAIRALRVLRTITFFQNLQVIVTTLLRSIPAMASISLIIFLVIYIFGIIGVTIYGDVFPERFGTVWVAWFSLFQLITLDDWFEMYDAVKHIDGSMILFLIIFIICETFIFINLFVAVIVSNLEILQSTNLKHVRAQKRKDFLAKQKKELEIAQADQAVYMNANNKRYRSSIAEGNPEEYFNFVANPRERRCLNDTLQLMASLENNIHSGQSQLALLDDLVEISDQNKKYLAEK